MGLYDIIRAQMTSAVPFAAYTGLDVTEVANGRGVATLQQRDEVSNHIGSLHAGALFTLGEAASGAAMSGAFADIFMDIRPVAADAKIAYIKVAKGAVTATATVGGDGVEAVRAAFDAEGKVKFPVEVSICDNANQEVAIMSVAWHVSQRRHA